MPKGPVLLHTEASLGWGGQEMRVVLESKGLSGMGYSVAIAAPSESRIFEEAAKAGIKTFAVPMRRSYGISSIAAMKRVIRESGAEIVCTHSSIDSWLAVLAARFMKKAPALVRMRHLSTPVRKGPVNGFLYGSARMIITTGEAIREGLIRENGIEADKIVSIPTGVDTFVYKPSRVVLKAKEALGLKASDFVVGTVSVLRSWKGHAHLVEAAKAVLSEAEEARFVIAGDGPQRENIEKMVSDSGLSGKVLLLGHRKDVPLILSALDVFVFPSYANEGVPQALLQAMAMGKAVVASSLEPIKEIVKDGVTGIASTPRDPASIASAVLRLYRDESLRGRLGREAARLAAERYSLTAMLSRLDKTYRGILA